MKIISKALLILILVLIVMIFISCLPARSAEVQAVRTLTVSE